MFKKKLFCFSQNCLTNAKSATTSLECQEVIFFNSSENTILKNKKISARLHVYLRLESTNHQKIREITKARQICKQSTQTASL